MLYIPNSESFFLQPLKVTRRVFDKKSRPLSGHVLTQVYIDRDNIPTLKTRKDRKWCCPDQQKRETVLWVYVTAMQRKNSMNLILFWLILSTWFNWFCSLLFYRMYFLTRQQRGKFCQWWSNAQVTVVRGLVSWETKR